MWSRLRTVVFKDEPNILPNLISLVVQNVGLHTQWDTLGYQIPQRSTKNKLINVILHKFDWTSPF